MKELHLICNAHLDPVWMWDWEEGLTATLATFYSAVELANDFDYIFCHNEALLYEWVEKYDENLFQKIRSLIEKGKWHIMGGWYVQPDCNVPTGESFVRQIESGLQYFNEKFNKRPTVAINFDSFGHTQGLVQILSKCGYNGYLFCRPMPSLKDVPLKDNVFYWKGFDGSKVKAVRTAGESLYCTMLGNAVEDIKNKVKDWGEENSCIILWGVGNHGGGASRKDLKDIELFMKENADEYKVIHSTPEIAFESLTPTNTFDKALQPVLIKTYSSMTRFKQKFAELERLLYVTEKINVLANITCGFEVDEDKFAEAQKILSMVQFHDILSGTCVKTGEESATRKIEYAKEILNRQLNGAFVSIIKNDIKACDGDFPIFVFNPNAYETESIFESEILMLQAREKGENGYNFDIYNGDKKVEYQIIKEESSINYDRRKRFLIKSKLAPLSITRFDVKWKNGKTFEADRTPQVDFNERFYDVGLNGDGLVSSLKFDKVELLSGAIKPILYEDNPDPWGWNMKIVGQNYSSLTPTIINRITERGCIFTQIESKFNSDNSFVYLTYRIYKNLPYIDLKVNVNWGDEGKGLKLEIPVKEFSSFFGQTAFGIQNYDYGIEQCAQRYCGVKFSDKSFTVFSKHAFGTSIENGKLYINLFNGSVYCAHPIGDLPIIDGERYNEYIEVGKHEFSFRIALCEQQDCEKISQEFCEDYHYLNYYPHGNGTIYQSLCKVSNDTVTISALRNGNGKIMIRLVNNTDNKTNTDFYFSESKIKLSFGKYEVKTLIYQNGNLSENNSMLVDIL